MRKEWVCELRFLWFLQFLQLPPGLGVLLTRAALGQIQQTQGRICRKDSNGRVPPPRVQKGL